MALWLRSGLYARSRTPQPPWPDLQASQRFLDKDVEQTEDDASYADEDGSTYSSEGSSREESQRFNPADVGSARLVVQPSTNTQVVLCCFPKSWIFIPRNNKKLRIWEVFVGACAILTAFWTPSFVGFGVSTQQAKVIDNLQSIVFVTDIILQFFIAIPAMARPSQRRCFSLGSKTEYSSFWVKDPGEIARTYLRGWFVIDVLAVFPFDHVMNFACYWLYGSPDEVAEGDKQLFFRAVLSALHLLRILRLLRLTRLTSMLETVQYSLGLQYAHMQLMKLFFSVLLVLHCIACLWAGLGMNGEMLRGLGLVPGLAECLEEQSKCAAMCAEEHEKPEEQSECAAGCERDYCKTWLEYGWPLWQEWPYVSWKVYCRSFYWAVVTLTTIGYGDICPINPVEIAICILIMCVGSSLWAYVIGGVFKIISTLNPAEDSFASKMEALNDAMEKNDLPEDLRWRAREYMQEAKSTSQKTAGRREFAKLSADLRGELNYVCLQEFFHAANWRPFGRSRDLEVNLFAGVDDSIRYKIAQHVMMHFHGPLEDVGSRRAPTLSYLYSGMVARFGRVYRKGAVWGQDVLLESPKLWTHPLTVKAMSYCQVLALSRNALLRVRLAYPKECASLRKLQVKMALYRGFILQAACRAFHNPQRLLQQHHALHNHVHHTFDDEAHAQANPHAIDGRGAVHTHPHGGPVTVTVASRLTKLEDHLNAGFSLIDAQLAAVERRC